MERCHGLFYRCAGGAEARRFNRLLIDAGLIKGLVKRVALRSRGAAAARTGEPAAALQSAPRGAIVCDLAAGPNLPAGEGLDGRRRDAPAARRLARDVQAAVALTGVDVAFRLADGVAYTAVERASLSVADGEFVAIVGPTGCGKSTLLNVAAGLLGAVVGHRRDLRRAARRAQPAGRLPVPGRGAVPVEDRARQRRHRARGRRHRARARRARAPTLGSPASASPASASAIRTCSRAGSASGSAWRRCLIRDPKILLMDEPFGPLDAQTRQIMGNLLLDLWSADRKAVMFVTHDLEEAIALSDRVVIMSAGPAARIIGDWRVPLRAPARHRGSEARAPLSMSSIARSGRCSRTRCSRATR